MKLSWLALPLLFVGTQSEAAWMSGNDLMAKCRSDDIVDLAQCYGYIKGALDAGNGGAAVMSSGRPVLPYGVTAGQLRDVVLQYMDAHPEWRHKSAGDLVYIAVRVTFPNGDK